ncbi:MAG: hypothetical protein H6713_03700 [Myxococcales bacterium]|nr:hypothetical protein [Myxococcales bacterium]
MGATTRPVGCWRDRGAQFSFCVALYEALFAERPFTGVTLEQLMRAVTEGAPREPPRSLAVPRRVRVALRRGLAREPSRRFPSMHALRARSAPGARAR